MLSNRGKIIMDASNPGYPVRAGVFSTVEHTRNAIENLKQAGFDESEISVVCSSKSVQEHFPEAITTEPAGSHSSQALTVAGIGALGLGAVAAGTALVTTAGTALFIIGAFSPLAIAGTFVALMSTRGMEPEVADYYDQAVEAGKILVAVEVAGDDEKSEQRRKLASEIISRSGAEPLSLSH